ncbi:transcriptional regulator, TetR family [Dethiosulfovibrio peptidovorans DSM 11002]|uniref:Transcriptional regulator, TetR family n=1 Tax=Dethiosulfovibrio peptidovorans DSM 11002 TaxID=469381 RepID=D2Z6C9_9BACT|nr:hypothetical protein [Dethiosulfovibrio peptidovorans]EFC91026.1 transcriptional regulator, TetR family [Dethiosulfovibrio peptidovorans DSM 11002]
MILFYFQNKEGLYEAVKDGIVDQWRDKLQPKPVPVGAGPEFISDMIEVAFSFYRDNPRMVRMANWGRLERDDVSPLSITAMVCGTVHVWWEFHGYMRDTT